MIHWHFKSMMRGHLEKLVCFSSQRAFKSSKRRSHGRRLFLLRPSARCEMWTCKVEKTGWDKQRQNGVSVLGWRAWEMCPDSFVPRYRKTAAVLHWGRHLPHPHHTEWWQFSLGRVRVFSLTFGVCEEAGYLFKYVTQKTDYVLSGRVWRVILEVSVVSFMFLRTPPQYWSILNLGSHTGSRCHSYGLVGGCDLR